GGGPARAHSPFGGQGQADRGNRRGGAGRASEGRHALARGDVAKGRSVDRTRREPGQEGHLHERGARADPDRLMERQSLDRRAPAPSHSATRRRPLRRAFAAGTCRPDRGRRPNEAFLKSWTGKNIGRLTPAVAVDRLVPGASFLFLFGSI